MKTKYITLTILLLAVAFTVNAQPLPPTAPSGSPVPLGELAALLGVGLMGLGTYKLRKKKTK